MQKDNLLNDEYNLDVAIIGIVGRFPGAANVEEFWHNLCNGVESVTRLSDDELLKSGVEPSLLNNPNYVKAVAILDNPEGFDASFFGYSPQEATMMDPQQRIFLECAWQVLEQAGYTTDQYNGLIAVYAGAGPNQYFSHASIATQQQTDDLATLISSDKDFLATRVSYKLNLKGPSMTIGTGCSTSLVAVHMACQSLLNHETDMAMAGGVSIRVPPRAGYLYRQGGIASPDGHCRAFDAEAQGTIFSSGAGVVLLKRMADAISDNDNIYAVIKGSAINNDGNAKVSYTAPSVNGQSEVIAAAYDNAGIDADTISYIETHGSGTALGDPIEVAALTEAFSKYTNRKGFCAIGSVKTNIGHTDIAAGIAGLIKTVMALKYKKIPPSLHFNKPNPNISFPDSPFYVNTVLSEWKTNDVPRRAGVSSFGVGGTNAHIVLEETSKTTLSGKTRERQLLLLSAKTDIALETATHNLSEYLANHPDVNLADVAYTLQVGRKAFNHRRMLVCKDVNEALSALKLGEGKDVLDYTLDEEKREVVFVFSGQGSQYVNMGLELYRTEPVVKQEMDNCFKILQSYLNEDLYEIVFPQGPVTDEAKQKLTQTIYTQTALFTIEYALAKLWMSWGIQPSAMMGHSIGEYVAACLAGVLSLEDALKVVSTRGKLMQQMPGGSMLAVFLPENEVKPLLGEKLSLAVINGPSLCVVSGEKDDIAELEKYLAEKKIPSRHVHTSHAFHSAMMEPILNTFAEEVKKAKLNTPMIPFLSNVSGTWITPEEATDPGYWARHLRQTVRFSDCLAQTLKEPNRIILEVGPGNTFCTLAKQHPMATKEHIILASTHHPKEEVSDVAYILNTLGQLWMGGIEIDWAGFYVYEKRCRLPLPTYPFERQRYWTEISHPMQDIPSTVADSSGGQGKGTIERHKNKKKKAEVAYRQVKSTEEILTEIWQNALGIKKINLTDDFFRLGGNSLTAVGIFDKIEHFLKKKLPIATLYQAPTIEQLAEVLRNSEEKPAWKCLIEMKPGNSKIPLFLFHAGGGNVFIYHELLGYLQPEQRVYGLQSSGLDREKPLHTSIEDMAEYYIKEIQNIQPQGPYLLGGFCLGGTVALDVARRLYAQGQEVAMLLFMETYRWSNIPPRTIPDKIYYYLQKVEFNLGRLFSGEKGFVKRRLDLLKEKIALLVETVKSKNGLKVNIDNGYHSLLYILEATNDNAGNVYVPKGKYPGYIVQFVPSKEYKELRLPEANWNEIADGEIELHTMHGYPRQMLTHPFVKLLAEKINECIRKALEKPNSNI